MRSLEQTDKDDLEKVKTLGNPGSQLELSGEGKIDRFSLTSGDLDFLA